MDELKLNTDVKIQRTTDLKMLIVLFGIISVLCWFVLGTKGLGAFFGTEAVIFLALAWTYYRSYKNGGATLHFKGDSLEISYGDGRKYSVKDVDRSFFSLTQTEKQKALDLGTLFVVSTNMKIQYIKNFSAMEQYIATHFEKVAKSIYYLDDEDLEDEE